MVRSKVVNIFYNLGKALCEDASLYLASISQILRNQIPRGSPVRINVSL